MFSLFPRTSTQNQPQQQPHQQQHPQGQQQVQVQREPIVFKPSARLVWLRNMNNWQFLLVTFSAGVTLINFSRLSSAHLFLGIIAVVAGSLALFVMSPANRTYSGLWRSGGAGLAIGGILAFWDLYHLLTWIHYLAIAVVVIFAIWIIGAGSK